MTDEKTIERLGRFKIVGVLGQGAMGIVYKALDEKIDRVVAIKTLQLQGEVPEDRLKEFRERFLHEAQFAGKLSHPNIVTIFDVEEDGDTTYIAMEYVEGKTLEQMIDKEPELPIGRMIEIMLHICDGLSYAHKNGVIHRDIKPANVIVTGDGSAKIMDFGIAKVTTSNNTVVGTILGTPGYMSPEQITGRTVDHRADIFSLGAVFYELLTQRKAFTGANLTEVMYKVVNENPTPVSVVNPLIPPVFDTIISRALRRNADERYRTVDFLAQDIRRVELTLTMTNPDHSDEEKKERKENLTDTIIRRTLEVVDYKKLLIGLSIYSFIATAMLILIVTFGRPNPGSYSKSFKRPASLSVVMNVPDAIVTIDGSEIKTARNVLKIDSIGVGEHKLAIRRDFYEPYETALVFAGGEAKEVEANLKLSPVEIRAGIDTSYFTITSTPRMAKVETSSGRFIGYTPIENFAFPGGNYTLLFSKEDYLTKTKNVSLRRNRLSPIDAALDKLRGTVSLEKVHPENAALFIGGKKLYRNSKANKFGVEVGEQNLTVHLDGYEDVEKKILIKADSTYELSDSLKPLYGTLQVKSNPTGAEIYLDDSETSVGMAPVYIPHLLANTHKIKAVSKREKKVKTVKVDKNDTTQTTVVFSNPNGYLEFTTSPPGAAIYINTALRDNAKTPGVIEMQPGFHKIRLVHPNYPKFYEITVRVRPEMTTKVEYKFE
jgi:serine/threonine protein kinase